MQSQSKRLAVELCRDVEQSGLLLGHAGSFDFDFGAAERCHDRLRDCYAIRIDVPDLPTVLWDEVTRAVAEWWSEHD